MYLFLNKIYLNIFSWAIYLALPFVMKRMNEVNRKNDQIDGQGLTSEHTSFSAFYGSPLKYDCGEFRGSINEKPRT